MSNVRNRGFVPGFALPSQREDLNKDEVYDILSNQRRRVALRYLFQRENSCPVSELVDVVAGWEATHTGADRSDKLEASVYSAMVQSHLPRMADYGFVEYDSDARLVSLTDKGRLIEPYLDLNHRTERAWVGIYVGVSLIGIVLMLSGRFGIGVDLSDRYLATVGIVFFVIVFLLSTIHGLMLYRRRRRARLDLD